MKALLLLLASLLSCHGQFLMRSPAFVASLQSQSSSAPSFPSGAIHYWTMSAGGGGVDDAVDGEDLFITAPSSFVAGKNGNCAEIGSGGKLETTGTIQGPPASWSVVVWVKLGSGGQAQVVLDSAGDSFVYASISSSSVDCNITDGGTILSASGVSESSWHLIAWTYSGGTQSLSIDGSAFTTQTDSASFLGSVKFWSLAGTVYFDEAAIFSRALNITEVGNIWNGGAGTFGP